MKLVIRENFGLGIYIVNLMTGEIFESGYETMAEAKRALRNFKQWHQQY